MYQDCFSVVSGGPRGASLIRVSGLYQRCIKRTEGDVADTCIRTVSGVYISNQEDVADTSLIQNIFSDTKAMYQDS